MKKVIVLILLCACLVGCGKTEKYEELYIVRISDLEGNTDIIFAEKIWYKANRAIITAIDGTKYTTSYNNVVIKKREGK